VAKLSIKSLVFIACLAIFGSAARAALTVQVSPGSTFSVPNVVDFSPTGFDMTGLKVTATFSNGSTDTAFWTVPGSPLNPGAYGSTWSLSESGDTFFNAWHLQYSGTQLKLTNLLIEGGSFGHTLFDLQGLGRTTAGAVTPGNADAVTGTTGSERGYTFDPVDPNIATNNSTLFPGLDVSSTYSNLVKLDAASSPVGDLFTTLQIDFSPQPGGGLLGDFFGPIEFDFYADTDLWGTEQAAPIPEPSSLVLCAGLGLIGAWQYGRSKVTRKRAPS
jgi:PEP-CTERM motif-containing protein